MPKAMCGKCGVRFAQQFAPPRCRACVTGRELEPNGDYSAAEIERRFQRAWAEIKARNRPEPSREYHG